jgi:hypothetical protein
MERENPLYKIEGSLGFNTGDKDSGMVTKKLGIEPTKCWNRGDKYFGKRTKTIYSHSDGIWGYKAKPIFTDAEDISSIIQYFRELLSDKMLIVSELINKYQFECNLHITVYSEDGGYFATTIDKNDLLFLSHFSRFDISFLQVEY